MTTELSPAKSDDSVTEALLIPKPDKIGTPMGAILTQSSQSVSIECQPYTNGTAVNSQSEESVQNEQTTVAIIEDRSQPDSHSRKVNSSAHIETITTTQEYSSTSVSNVSSWLSIISQ